MDQLSIITKACLVSTCTAPVLFVYSFLAYTKGHYYECALFFFITLFLGASCVKLVQYYEKKGHSTTIHVSNFKAADKEVSGFFVSYLIPVIGAGEFFYDLERGAFFVALFFVFIWASKSYYANPILGLFGYKFFELTTDSGKTLLLITKNNVEKKEQIGKIRYLTTYTVVNAG